MIQTAITKFESLLKTQAAHVDRLGGLSNYVLRITDHKGHRFIFKILVSDKEDPFKKNEQGCLPFIFQICQPPIFESEHYRIEICIQTPELEMDHFTDRTVSSLLQRSIAKFNSANSVKGQKPNLLRILDMDKHKIMAVIDRQIANSSVEDQAVFRQQLARIDALLAVLDDEYKFDELVLSHNDLFYRNLLFDEHKQVYHLIDFEYVGYNPKGMDIFQFVDEWLTDYVPQWPHVNLAMHKYPSQEHILEMVRTYLYFYDNWREVEGQQDNQALLDRVRDTPQYKAIPEAEVTRIAALFPYFGVLANAFWFYWSLYVYHMEGIEFDYVHFAKIKFEMIELFVQKLNNPRATEAFGKSK